VANVAINVDVKSNGEVVLGKVAGALDVVGKKADTATDSLAKMAKGLAVGAAARELWQLVTTTASWAEEIDKASRRTGIGAQAIQQYERVAKNLGMQLGDVTSAVSRMQVALGKGDGLAKFGVDVEKIRAMKPEQQLETLAQQWASLTSQTERAAFGQAAWGKGWGELVPVLEDVAAGVGKNTGLTEQQLASLNALDDMLDKGARAWEDFTRSMLASAAGSGAFKAAIEFLTQLPQAIVYGLGQAQGAVLGFFGTWMTNFGQLGQVMDKHPWIAKLLSFGAYKQGTGQGLTDFGNALKVQADAARQAGLDSANQMSRSLKETAKKSGKDYGHDFGKAAEDAIKELGADFARTLGRKASSDLKVRGNAGEMGPSLEEMMDPLRSANPKWLTQLMPAAGKSAIHLVVNETTQADIAAQKAAQSAAVWAGALQGVALMAGIIGGNMGNALQVIGNIGQSFQGWGGMNGQQKFNTVASGVGQIGALIGGRNRKTGGAIAGVASGAMTGAAIGSIVPGIGNVVGGVVGGVIGGVAGWLGGRKKEKEEKRALEEAFLQMEDGLKKQYGSLAAAETAAEKYGVSLKWALDNKNAKSLDAALKDLEKRMKGLETATQGVNQLIDNLTYTDAAGNILSTFSDPSVAQSAGNLFGAQFWAVFQRQGIAGIDAMRPQWGKLLEEMTRQGLDPAALGLGRVGRMMDLTNDPKMRALLGASQGTGNLLSGAMDAQYIDRSMLADANNIAQKTFEALQQNGMTAEEAAQASEEQLATLAKAYQAQGQDMPQWLQDAMAAAGMELLPTQLDVLKESRDYLKQMAGASGYADGGIVTRPQLAWIGERGPEAVVPLSRTSSIGGSTNITIARTMGVTRETEYAFDRRVERVVSRALRQNGRIRRDAQVAVNGGR